MLAGSIDAAAADKASHFIMVADSFHLPIVFVADNPGMLPGSRSERSAVLRAGARVRGADPRHNDQVQRHNPQGLGFGSMVMAMMGFDHQSATFAYPGVTLGAMSARRSAGPCTPARRAEKLRDAESKRPSDQPTGWGSTSSSIPGRPGRAPGLVARGPCPAAKGPPNP